MLSKRKRIEPKTAFNQFRINAGEVNYPTRKKRKITEKTSAWLITVNPHVSKKKLSKKQQEEAEAALEDIVAEVFEENPGEYIIFNEDNKNMLNIKSIRNYLKIEYQERNKAQHLHSHNWLQIKHDTNIHIDYDIITNKFQMKIKEHPLFESIAVTGAGGSVPDVHIERGSASGENEKEYMEKGTHTYWSKKKVARYYEKLKENGDTDPEKWNKFVKVKNQDFIPEGFVPGSQLFPSETNP